MFLLLSVLFQLDTAVVNRQDYVAAREARIADNTRFYQIASPENQYTYAYNLWEEYNGFDNDSAICYAQNAIRIARANHNRTAEQRSTICLAQSMAATTRKPSPYSAPLRTGSIRHCSPPTTAR